MTGASPSRSFSEPPAAPGDGAAVDLADPDRRLGLNEHLWIAEHARRGVALLAATGEVRVRVVGDAEMAAAHERYQGIPGTTDVLTFDLNEAPPGPAADVGAPSPRELDTDILICADEAARQAAARGHSPDRELLLYLIHGLLHCLGHDDHDAAEAARMHAVEDRVLEALGVGATFSRPAHGSDEGAGGRP